MNPQYINQCWEDPGIDKRALNIGDKDRIVMITSAGCNALDYLLSGPERIDCVDLNPHQTALLELKLAALRTLPHANFFSMFGAGRIKNHAAIYKKRTCGRFSAWRAGGSGTGASGILMNAGAGCTSMGHPDCLHAPQLAVRRQPGLRESLEHIQTTE